MVQGLVRLGGIFIFLVWWCFNGSGDSWLLAMGLSFGGRWWCDC